MIFADKLIALRKKAGWSQEELAQQLNVSRQSVSKWEGAQSVPDLDKIVQLSRIFGVSTDYLLKDELEAQETAEPEPEQPARRRVSLEEASQYLELRKQAAPWLALATFLCVLSPITLILLAGLSEYTARISENVAGGIGLCVLILMVAAAVGIFLMCGAKAKPFAFLETEPFETEYGVSGMVRQRRQEFEPTANRLNLIGTILCIVSVLPLFAAMCLSARISRTSSRCACCWASSRWPASRSSTQGRARARWKSCWRRATIPGSGRPKAVWSARSRSATGSW